MATMYLYTGVPGAGKTSHAIDDWYFGRHKVQPGRQVFTVNLTTRVPGWTDLGEGVEGFARWVDTPDDSVIIVDEAYRSVPGGAIKRGQEPHYVQRLATHRHTGHDIIFIAQAPGMLPAMVRDLVGVHYHFHRWKLLPGFTRRWMSDCCMGQTISDGVLRRASVNIGRFPSRVYALYDSAVIHRSMGMRSYLLVTMTLALLFLGWQVWGFAFGGFRDDKPQEPDKPVAQSKVESLVPGVVAVSSAARPLPDPSEPPPCWWRSSYLSYADVERSVIRSAAGRSYQVDGPCDPGCWLMTDTGRQFIRPRIGQGCGDQA